MTAIQEQLFALQDISYREFQAKLMPTVPKNTVIGVRTPALRALAKSLDGTEEAKKFLRETPHIYFEENQLHAFLIAGEKDFAVCIEELEQFLPFIDNWATCDQLSPKIFRKHREELLPFIDRWILSEHTYTVRYAIGLFMNHFLDEKFEVQYAKRVAAIRSDEYYVNMMVAWYFATALAKHYEAILPFLEEKRLAVWTHNKTIQKAVESYRITPEQKQYLKTLRVKKMPQSQLLV